MDRIAIEDESPGQATASSDPIIHTSVLEYTQSLLDEWLGLAHDRLLLAALETRRAGESLVFMIVAGVLVAILLAGSWLGLMAAIVLGLIENGVEASSAILLTVDFNLLLALILSLVIHRKSRYLQFPATLRSLQARAPGLRDPDAQQKP
jgi:hypothetical protein